MPSIEWLQKDKSSSRTLRRRGKAVCCTQTVLPSKSTLQGWAGVTQTCCTLVLNVPDQAHSTHN